MKARQERPRFSVEEPPDYVEQEEMVNLVGTEAAKRFMQVRRSEDPYFGMRPDDALAQIVTDAASADTEEKQARIKAAITKYTPTAVTFGDLFVDSRKERMMENLANVAKIFPKIKEAKSAVDLLKESEAQAELDLPPEQRASAIKRRQAKANLDKTLRSMKRDRGSKNYGKTLDKIRRDVRTIANADHNVESQKQKVSQLKVFETFTEAQKEKIGQGAQVTFTTKQRQKLNKEELATVDAYNGSARAAENQISDELRKIGAAIADLGLGNERRAVDLLKSVVQRDDQRSKAQAEEQERAEQLRQQIAKTQEENEMLKDMTAQQKLLYREGR
jgi:hypothetical protein